MLLGVFADVGVCLITILNTLRILKYGGKWWKILYLLLHFLEC
jgi:hypothetical protein